MQVPGEDHGKAMVARTDDGDSDDECASPTQRVNALRAMFDQQGPPKPLTRANTLAHTPVRRTRSEGQVRGGGAVSSGDGTSLATPTPEVVMDATLCDRLWSALDAGSHRDSVSSSSSISSNDTVIDLSLPNLASSRSPRPCPAPPANTPHHHHLHHAVRSSPLRHPYASMHHTAQQDTPRPVSKSKSNPNLRREEEELDDELRPRPLSREPRPSPSDVPPMMQRRHTWSRLYMEGLKQASAAAAASASARRPPPPPTLPKPSFVSPATAPSSPPAAPLESAAAKSKSLGDLTSDDIACHFESKYRSISRSFLCRPPPRADQRRLGLGGSATAAGGLSSKKTKSSNDLTEQLRRLTDVEPLTSSDFSQRPARGAEEEGSDAGGEGGEWDQQQQPPPLRRMSSRSQSRVRYIANRAKQAQERQRMQQGLLGLPRGGVMGGMGGMGGGLLEERGNPEGACSVVARSPCSSADILLSQLPPGPPSPRQTHHHQAPYHHHQTQDDRTLPLPLPPTLIQAQIHTQTQTPPQSPNQTQIQAQNQNQSPLGPQDNGMFFMLKL